MRRGIGYDCSICGKRDPCWSGDTLVLQPGGTFKKVRDCTVGDEVCTLQGSKHISRVWGRRLNYHPKEDLDTEVCCIDGVWITSHHPIISGDRWVFPADLQASAPWHRRKHLVPDMFNFELEGHDDTILLWGGGGLVVSCTIGKYLGERFGRGVCTRRSTRCQHPCEQCDAVFVEGLEHNNIPSEMRWSRFPEYPEVEWDHGVSEFELAAEAAKSFSAPQELAAAIVLTKLWASVCCEPATTNQCTLAEQLPATF